MLNYQRVTIFMIGCYTLFQLFPDCRCIGSIFAHIPTLFGISPTSCTIICLGKMLKSRQFVLMKSSMFSKSWNPIGELMKPPFELKYSNVQMSNQKTGIKTHNPIGFHLKLYVFQSPSLNQNQLQAGLWVQRLTRDLLWPLSLVDKKETWWVQHVQQPTWRHPCWLMMGARMNRYWSWIWYEIWYDISIYIYPSSHKKNILYRQFLANL